MELSSVLTQTMTILNQDSSVTVRFDPSEAQGIRSLTIESDFKEGFTAYVFTDAGSNKRYFKDAVSLIIHYSSAVIEVL